MSRDRITRGGVNLIFNMYAEDQMLPLSAVSQFIHCPRRFALLNIEQVWEDNQFTAEGVVMHEKVDSGKKESRGRVRIIRSLRLRSLKLGVTGIADVVELHRCDSGERGAKIQHVSGMWIPFPVEYKRGASKHMDSYQAQLCLQALCLEEMLDVSVPQGALFLGVKQQRIEVVFDAGLRDRVSAACRGMHALFVSGTTPVAVYSKRCESCSVIDLCKPRTVGSGKGAQGWLDARISDILGGSVVTHEKTP